jgi:hypothetical protein
MGLTAVYEPDGANNNCFPQAKAYDKIMRMKTIRRLAAAAIAAVSIAITSPAQAHGGGGADGGGYDIPTGSFGVAASSPRRPAQFAAWRLGQWKSIFHYFWRRDERTQK